MMKPHFLIADDSTTIQKALKLALKEFDLELDFVCSFEELEKRISSTNYQGFLVDANLPGLAKNTLVQFVERQQPQPTFVLEDPSCGLTKNELSLLKIPYILQKPFSRLSVTKILKEANFSLKSSAETTHQSKKESKVLREEKEILPRFFEEKNSDKQLQAHLNALKEKLEPTLENHLKRYVENYCRQNFQKIASQVISDEIRKLAEEKAKALRS